MASRGINMFAYYVVDNGKRPINAALLPAVATRSLIRVRSIGLLLLLPLVILVQDCY